MAMSLITLHLSHSASIKIIKLTLSAMFAGILL